MRDRAIHEQRLSGVAHPVAAAFRIQHDSAGHSRIGRFVHVYVAVARSRFDDGHLGMLDAVPNKACSPAGNEHVDDTVKCHELIGCRTVGRLYRADAVCRHARTDRRIMEYVRNDRIGAGCKGSAAKHAGVARFDADARSVSRHVRTRFVYHADHPERYAHALQIDAAFQFSLHLHRTQRIRQAHEILERRRHRLDARSVEHEAIEQALARIRPARRIHIGFVLGHDLACMLAQRASHGIERGVALDSRCRRELLRGSLRRKGDVAHRFRHTHLIRHSNTTNSSR